MFEEQNLLSDRGFEYERYYVRDYRKVLKVDLLLRSAGDDFAVDRFKSLHAAVSTNPTTKYTIKFARTAIPTISIVVARPAPSVAMSQKEVGQKNSTISWPKPRRPAKNESRSARVKKPKKSTAIPMPARPHTEAVFQIERIAVSSTNQ